MSFSSGFRESMGKYQHSSRQTIFTSLIKEGVHVQVDRVVVLDTKDAEYISVFAKVKEQSRYNVQSCAELLLMPPRTITRKTLGYRAFASAIRGEGNFNRFQTLVNSKLL